jgi:hypothetical protein
VAVETQTSGRCRREEVRMGKRVRLVAALGVVALLMSSCLLSIKGYSVSRRGIAPGQKAVVTLKLYPYVDVTTNLRAVPFVLVAQLDNSPALGFPGTGRVFDTKENYGGAPRSLQRDDQMRDVLIDGSACADYPIVDDTDWLKTLFRTENPVNVKNKADRVALTKIPMKMPGAADMENVFTVEWAMIAGMWSDNPEDGTIGQPDAEDSFFCTSSIQSNFYGDEVTETEAKEAKAKARM